MDYNLHMNRLMLPECYRSAATLRGRFRSPGSRDVSVAAGAAAELSSRPEGEESLVQQRSERKDHGTPSCQCPVTGAGGIGSWDNVTTDRLGGAGTFCKSVTIFTRRPAIE